MGWNDLFISQAGMAYREAGDGTTLVLLHGIPGSGAGWRAVVEMLPQGIRVLVPDLLGFGGSTCPSSSSDLLAAGQAIAVERLLDELGVSSAIVVGHDFGGPVALLLADRRPELVRAVGLLAANVFTDTPIPFPLATVTSPIIGPVARRLLFSTASLKLMVRQGVGPGTQPPPTSSYVGRGDQPHAIATIFSASLTRLDELYAPVEAALRKLTVPTFVGWGDKDPFFALVQGERTADAAGTTLRVYKDAGHFLPHERPAELSEDIARLVLAAVP